MYNLHCYNETMDETFKLQLTFKLDVHIIFDSGCI